MQRTIGTQLAERRSAVVKRAARSASEGRGRTLAAAGERAQLAETSEVVGELGEDARLEGERVSELGVERGAPWAQG